MVCVGDYPDKRQAYVRIAPFSRIRQSAHVLHTSLLRTYVQAESRTHTHYIPRCHTHAPTTYLQLVCEPNLYPNFLTYIQVSFFLWGFLKPILGCGIVVFGGQGSHQDISLECVTGFVHFPLLHSGEFLHLTRGTTHVYRGNRRNSDNYCTNYQYHADSQHGCQKRTTHTLHT